MRILYITTISNTMKFFRSYIKKLLDEGHTVDLACRDPERLHECFSQWNCRSFPVSYSRNPFSSENIKAVKETKKLAEAGRYDIVHCHTPVAAACARIALRKLRKKSGTRVIYTAHGFHFFTGAPLKNWLVYYPTEWILSYSTDTLITITKEDYERARRRFHPGRVAYVPGVGVDTSAFSSVRVDKNAKRESVGVPKDAFFVLSVGELNDNKNHRAMISALKFLPNDVFYAVAGRGDRADELVALAESLGVSDRFALIGHRSDIPEIMACADTYVLPSKREGLNVSVMEAMASGLPVVCFDIRGNRDLVRNGSGGFLAKPYSEESLADCVKKLYVSPELRADCAVYNSAAANEYSVSNINALLDDIYFDS